jgi:chromosome partitioning protein
MSGMQIEAKSIISGSSAQRDAVWNISAIIACSGKGGCGKSTTTTNLAALALRAGHRVGIIDADPQRSSFEWRRLRANKDIGIHRCSPDQIGEAIALAAKCRIDVVLIDMPPGARYALLASHHADLVIVPTRPSLFDVRVTMSVIQILKSAQRPYTVVINAAPPRRNGAEAPAVRETRDLLATVTRHVCAEQIAHRLVVGYAILMGAGVIEAEPGGRAAAEYEALWRSLRAKLNERTGSKNVA